VLERGLEVAVGGDWIAEVDRDRRTIERQFGEKPTNKSSRSPRKLRLR
jgi:hypothetical protein